MLQEIVHATIQSKLKFIQRKKEIQKLTVKSNLKFRNYHLKLATKDSNFFPLFLRALLPINAILQSLS